MPAVTLDPLDLEPFAEIPSAKAEEMITDALALAARVAPCILTEEFEYTDAARAILRGAILRWNDSGSGAVSQQTAGPFSQSLDTRQQRRSMFFPSEIDELQALCGSPVGRAFEIDTMPTDAMT